MRWLSAEARISQPWANGRGRTRLVAEGPAWRLSIAELEDASPFSSFDGASRRFMPVPRRASTGPAAVLSVNGQRRAVDALVSEAFEGEDVVFAVEVPEPLEVVNLIWQRQSCRATLGAVSVAGARELSADGGVLVAILITGCLVPETGPQLGRLDAVRLEDGERATLSGTGQLALARVTAAERLGSPRP